MLTVRAIVATIMTLVVAVVGYVVAHGWAFYWWLGAAVLLYTYLSARHVAVGWTAGRPADEPIPLTVSRFAFYVLPPMTAIVLSFAAAYWQLGHAHVQHNLSSRVGPVGALYFATTVFTTTGFGDLHATSRTCRGVVTAQMLVDFSYLALIFSVFIAHFAEAIRRRPAELSGG